MSMYESQYELPGEVAFETWELAGEVQGEAYETELAMELLEITNEQELEEFLGKLVRGAVKGVGRFMKSGVGKAIGGVLKNVAKTALPMAGTVLGNLVLPGVGGAIGGRLAGMASKLLEVGEAEMMGEQEAELEAARRYVRFARAAVRNAAMAPPNLPPRVVVRTAAVSAARRYAPTLLRPSGTATPQWRARRAARYGSGPRGGTWGPPVDQGWANWPPGPMQPQPQPQWGYDAGSDGGAQDPGAAWPSSWDHGSWDSGWGASADPYAGATYEASPGGFELP